jgi:DinB superfamily
MQRPEKTEYDPYYEGYVELVEKEDIIDLLERQKTELSDAFGGFGEDRGNYRYAEGKWSIKELLSHIIDGERMFAYRVFRISRGDKTPIEGFEQDGYIENSHANERSFGDMIDEFENLRSANLLFFRNLQGADWARTGTANEMEISVRALAFIMGGHVRHHLNILDERYTS